MKLKMRMKMRVTTRMATRMRTRPAPPPPDDEHDETYIPDEEENTEVPVSDEVQDVDADGADGNEEASEEWDEPVTGERKWVEGSTRRPIVFIRLLWKDWPILSSILHPMAITMSIVHT
jgi:hypothetical protein